MSLALITVSAADELPCCMEGHRKFQLDAKSASDGQLGAAVGSESVLTKSNPSCRQSQQLMIAHQESARQLQS